MEATVLQLTDDERAECDRAVKRRLLAAPLVEVRYQLTSMGLWRWIHDESLGFPSPLVIRNRNYFWLDELEAWERRMALESIGKKAQTPGRQAQG